MSGPLAGASYEYDATVVASITGALNVTAWADQSGNGRDLNSVVGTPKTGIRTINGLNAISFAGGSELLFRNPLVIASPRTIFAVVQSNVSAGPALDAELKWVNHGGGGSGIINTTWCGEGGNTNLKGGRVDNAPHVITWVNNGTSSAIWVDGLLVVTGGDATTSSTADIEIGGDGGSQGWNGLIGHVFGYPSALNDSDRNLVEQYLIAKWLAIPSVPTFAPPWGTGHPAAVIPAIDLTDYDPNSGVTAPDHVGVGVDLSGSGAAASAGTASPATTLDLSGKGTAASAGNAGLALTADLSGKGTAAAGSSVTFSVTAALSGKGTAASTGMASPLLAASLSGSGAASSYGIASPIATVLLTGHGDAASTGNANLSITADLSGKGSNAAGSRAEVLLTADLRGHGDAAAGSTAPLTATLSLSGKGAAASAGTASPLAALSLTGSGAASSVGRADITVSSAGGNAISLSGSGAAASTGTASPIITAALSGKGTAASTGRADVYLTVDLSGKGTAASTGTASINNTAALSGTGAAASAGTASLSVTVSLSGHGDGCSGGSGTLGKTVFLTGSGAAASGGRASFPVAVVVSAEQDSYSGARRNRILTINVRWVYPCRVTTSCTFVARRNTRCGHQIRTRVDTTTSRRHLLSASSQYQARTVTLADRLQDDMDAILAVLGARQETSL